MNDFHCDKVDIIFTIKAHVDTLLREVAIQDKRDDKLRVEFKEDLKVVKDEMKDEVDKRVVGMWKFVTLLISALAIAGQVMVYLVRQTSCPTPPFP